TVATRCGMTLCASSRSRRPAAPGSDDSASMTAASLPSSAGNGAVAADAGTEVAASLIGCRIAGAILAADAGARAAGAFAVVAVGRCEKYHHATTAAAATRTAAAATLLHGEPCRFTPGSVDAPFNVRHARRRMVPQGRHFAA